MLWPHRGRIETLGRRLSPEQAAAAAMVAQAGTEGLSLMGPDGLLKLFTKNVLETALQEEMTEHLGHERNRVDTGPGVGEYSQLHPVENGDSRGCR